MKANKSFKKIASAATAAILSTCTIMPISITNVSAASIEITNSQAGHTYEAYQIFSGDLAGGKLSNIQWGSGVNASEALMNEIKALNGFGSCVTAADVADVLSGSSDDSETAKNFAIIIGKYLTNPSGTSTAASSPYAINVAANGYYLIKDKDDTINDQEDKTYTEYIVQVLGDKTDIEAKSSLPTFEKKVNDINDTSGTAEALKDYADHDKGDEVTFTLKGTLPDNYDAFNAYKYVMHDSLSTGLTFNAGSLEVKVDGTKITSGYNLKTSTSDNHTFDIEFPDLKTISGVTKSSEITVTYTATLNDTADIGKPGNPNEAYLEYSNNPYDDGSDTAKTPSDEVIVYTYDVIIDKVDGNNNPLPNAGFTLYKLDSDGTTWNQVKKITASSATQFTFSGVDDGKYKLEESETPDGYNTIKPIYFEITANHENGLTLLSVQEQDENGSTISSGGYTFTALTDEGQVKTTIQNKSGSTLPSTGGIGTTPFYVGGGVLVAAAGVYIIVKKRMKNNENK